MSNMKICTDLAFYYLEVVLICLLVAPDGLLMTGFRLIIELISETTQEG